MRAIVIFLFLTHLGVFLCVQAQGTLEACPDFPSRDRKQASLRLNREVPAHGSFCLTIELEEVRLSCYDGGCGLFKSKRFRVSIDANLAAWRPTSERYLPTYQEQFVTVDGRPAWAWSFQEPKREFRYSFGILVKRKTDKYDFGLYFSSTEPGHEDLARAIFQSIRFSQK